MSMYCSQADTDCFQRNNLIHCTGISIRMSASVEITVEDGQYRAHDLETGTFGTGATRAGALAVLAARLSATEELADAVLQTELRTLAEDTRRRFEEHDVTDTVVCDSLPPCRHYSRVADREPITIATRSRK